MTMLDVDVCVGKISAVTPSGQLNGGVGCR